MSDLWKIYLFKGLRVVRVSNAGQNISRFRTQKTGALLAFLAFHPQPHAREVLVEMLWPESEPRVGGQSLRTALASLRRQLEPPDVQGGGVLIATRNTIQLNPQAVGTDVAEFTRDAGAARRAAVGSAEKVAMLERAVERYEGALLPGFYEEWVGLEAQRLEEEYFALLQQLIHELETAQNLPRALHFAREGVLRDGTRREIRDSLKRFCKSLDIAFDALNLPEADACFLKNQRLGAPSKPPRKKARAKKKVFLDARITDQIAPVIVSAPPSVALPALLNRFFGREAEVARVCEEFTNRKTRLLTLTGIGGSGKTRLAIEAAYQLLEAAPDNSVPFARAVFYVSLADLRDSDLILSAVLEVLGLPRAEGFLTGAAPEARPEGRLCVALGARPTLLVLDNFEHLSATGAQFVEMLLSCVPDLQVLVTSQHRLNIPGERELLVGALPIPPQPRSSCEEKENLPAMLEYAGVQLFLDRAQAVAPDFQLTRHNAASIAEVCRQLEGVPLAIELAGARCNVFPPSQIASRLRDTAEKFAMLTNLRGPATPRHASLHTAISWSYELLPPDLAGFWAQLSVFRGGFTFESAQAICRQPHAPHWLAQLRASSLISVEEQGGVMRFRLLEMLREYAGAQLKKTQRREINDRHARHFEEKLSASLSLLRTPQESEVLLLAAAETDNARAALEWAMAEYSATRKTPHDVKSKTAAKPKAAAKTVGGACGEYSALAARLALALGTLLQRRGLHGEALKTIETGLEAASCFANEVEIGIGSEIEKQIDLRVALLREHAGVLLDLLQWESASRTAGEMLALCRKRKDRPGIASATNLIGLAAKGQEQWASARKNFMDALQRFEKLGDVSGIAIAHNNLGLIEYLDEQGDKHQASTHLGQALELRHRLDDVRGVAEAHINLGALAQQVHETDKAQNHYQQALKIEIELGHAFGVGRALCNLGEVAETHEEIARAYRLYVSAHALFVLAGVAHQKYSATQSERLAGEVDECSALVAQAQQLSRSASLEEFARWADS